MNLRKRGKGNLVHSPEKESCGENQPWVLTHNDQTYLKSFRRIYIFDFNLTIYLIYANA